MSFSDKLNGFWEEGYHYYIEIRDGKMTVRDYRRSVMLETGISYDAAAVERGERTVISTDDNVLSRDGYGRPFTMIRELAWENGELKMLYYYTIMGETLYTLKKVDRGPFDHIRIRDDEFLDGLQGEWVRWRADGDKSDLLRFRGDRLWRFGIESEPIHVVSYAGEPDRVFIVPRDLTQKDFVSCTAIEVLPGMLTATDIVMDMDMPLSVFVREAALDSAVIPEAAKRAPRNTMIFDSHDAPMTDDPPVEK